MVILLRLASATHRNRMLGIFNALGPADDWNVRLVNAEDELRRILTDEKRIDGIITFMPREGKTRQLLQMTSVPTVAIGIDPAFSAARRSNLSTVCSDSALVAQTAVDYLSGLGSFASFAFMPDRSNRPWSVERGAELGDFLKSLAKPAAVLSPTTPAPFNCCKQPARRACGFPTMSASSASTMTNCSANMPGRP